MFLLCRSYAPGSTAICTLNTGSNFVDFKRSYLVMTVRNDSSNSDRKTAVDAWFGPNGSALNLINRVMLQTRSGVVIERTDNANQLASSQLYMTHDRTWTGTPAEGTNTFLEVNARAGNAFMYGAQAALGTNNASDDNWKGATALLPVSGDYRRFCIPCGELSTAWGNSESLWPSALCSGLRLELLLENANIALNTATSGDLVGYTVTDIRLECECYTLADLVLRSLNSMASSSGLEVLTVTAHDTQGTRAAASINLDCGRACSRALGYLYRERPVVSLNADADKFATVVQNSDFYVTQMQGRVGSQYFPLQVPFFLLFGY